MKLTKSQLKALIKEEMNNAVEAGFGAGGCAMDPNQCAGLPKLKELADQLGRVADQHGFSMDSGERVTHPLELLRQAIEDYASGQ
jgi:hypothetical protein